VFEGAKKSFVVSNNDERFILVGSSMLKKAFEWRASCYGEKRRNFLWRKYC
jgi:hypothetical protein